MDNNKKMRGFIGAAIAFSLFVTGCSAKQTTNSSDADNTEIVSSSDKNTNATALSNLSGNFSSDITDIFSDRDLSSSYDSITSTITLNGDSVHIDGKGAVANGSDIKITEEGIYLITGTLNDGQITVDTDAKVQLVLDNASISCSDSAPIYVVNADKTFITLADGSENSLSDGTSYTYTDESENEPDAVIFSTDSLTVNGTGSLTISANYNEGITSKDDLVIANCTLNINSIGNSIKGKDYVAITNSDITINSEADGIKSNNTDGTGLGFIYIESGTFNITAQEDGIQAETEFIAADGTFNITSGGGSSSAPVKTNNDFGQGGFGGKQFDRQGSSTDTTNVENTVSVQTETTDSDESTSMKGIKSGTAIFINGGDFTVDSADDTIHSNANVAISGGTFSLSSGDDGIHGGSTVEISGGDITIETSYEGIEGAIINVSGGAIDLTSSDDGFNASDGTSQGAMGSYSSSCQLNISGGTVCVNADGDGLDSNGDMTLSGGIMLINGPTNDGNGALDGNNSISCTGGILIAAGSSGMAEYPDESSTQNSVSVTFDSTQSAGTLVTLCDENGNELLSYTPAKTFNSVIISSPDILEGSTYTVYAGGTTSGEDFYGYYADGGYNNDGTETGSFTADSTTSFIGTQSSMGGGQGGFGNGNRGDMQIPTDENGDVDIPDGGFNNKDGIQMTTDENGTPQMPEGGFGGGGNHGGGQMQEPPTGEDGTPEMPDGAVFGSDSSSDTVA